jgi:MscS family membrane protein
MSCWNVKGKQPKGVIVEETMGEVLALLNSDQLRWSWQVFSAVALTLMLNFIATRILRRLHKHFSTTDKVWDDALIEAARTPVNIIILVIGLSWAVGIGNTYMESAVLSDVNLAMVRRLTVVLLFVMCLIRFISIIEGRYVGNQDLGRARWGDSFDVTTLSAIAKLLRLSVIISGILVALPTLGIEITALLAFGGVGGIAVGFAAKDLLANFFGGLTIYMDRPFVIGDWIRSPDRNIEGTVEKIGWRLTVVRTFDKRPLYIPNSVFSTVCLENPSRMTNRRIKETVGIRYQDADKMEVIVSEIKEMLIKHPDIDDSQTLMVNFDKYAASSLEFFIYTFTKTTNWVEFHAVKQDVLFKVVDIVLSHGAEFAFPTTTIEGFNAQMFTGRPESKPEAKRGAEVESRSLAT